MLSLVNGAILPGGAYGLLLSGLESTAFVNPAPRTWTRVALERRPLECGPARTVRAEAVHELAFANGSALRVERDTRRITFFVPEPLSDEELVHPYLAPAALTFAGWLGHAAFHAGAFVNGCGAWAVVAGRTGGKSTTLAALAARGVPVLADDVLVVSDGSVLAGPRCIDLRGDAPVPAGATEVRSGERKRVPLPPVEPSVPLCGFFVLEWGDDVALEPLRPAERLLALAARTRPETIPSSHLLDLARLPARRLVRPQRLASLDDVCERLLDATAD